MPESNVKDWNGITGGGKLGQKALLVLFHLTNVTVGYVILATVVPFYMLFGRKGYLAIYRYFKKQLGYSSIKSFYKTYINHFVFGQCMLDRFSVFAGRKNFFNINTTGNEEFYRLLDEEKGFIIASAHIGNFELCGYMLKQEKKRINALAFGGETKEIMKNRAKWFAVNNVNIIPVFEDMTYVIALNEALSNGEIVSVACDRNFGNGKSVECDFLAGKVDFPIGTFTLAAHFEIPVLSVFVLKESVSNYHVYVKPITIDKANATKQEKAELLTRAFVRELEMTVRKYPEQWFNFYEFWKIGVRR
jgi:predicted LPLAT superfamily acyltransferase